MKPKIFNSSYIAKEDIPSFYNSLIKKGTRIYTYNQEDGSPVKINNHWTWRVVVDTIPGATGHDRPIGNIRTALWYSQNKFDYKIE